jgi:hypothetical protein
MLRGQLEVLLCVTAGGTYSYQCGLNGSSREVHRLKFQKAAECDDVRTFSRFTARLRGW